MAEKKIGRRGWIVGGLAATALIVGAGVAASQPWGGHGSGFGGMRGERGVTRMLERLDATPEQKEKITAIMKGVREELQPMRGSMRTLREDAARLLKADTIDRAAIEKLRAQRIEQADAASKRMTKAFADAAEVLTPKQRAEFVGRMEGFASGRMAGRMGHRHGEEKGGHRGERHGEREGGMGRGMGQGMGQGMGEGRGPNR